MSEAKLTALRDLVQVDVGCRGLSKDPEFNLVNACPDDFEAACRSIATSPQAVVGVVTGFFIPHGQPPAAETDGPLGAIFLARALTPLGCQIVMITDAFCAHALTTGLAVAGLPAAVPVHVLPRNVDRETFLEHWLQSAEDCELLGRLTHLVALERVGPSHTAASIVAQKGATKETGDLFERTVAADRHDRCYTMRGRDITATMAPAHLLFENTKTFGRSPTTIGIGDGGNEIGMGKIPWNTIRTNISQGELIACRVPTDHLIVSGVSNWGAYALGIGVHVSRGIAPPVNLFDVEQEHELLRAMVEHGPLVDGVTGRTATTVDGLAFESYVRPLTAMRSIVQ